MAWWKADRQVDVPSGTHGARICSLLQVDFVDDAYGEYYPMAASFEGAVIDEDDEIVTTADRHEKTGGPVNEKEAARTNQQKLHTQLQKIEKIMRDKGYDHSEAFAYKGSGAPPRTPRTPARGAASTGQDPDLGMGASKKRQRIQGP